MKKMKHNVIIIGMKFTIIYKGRLGSNGIYKFKYNKIYFNQQFSLVL